ncbi:MAG: type I 3-dehydroquinate dehydratase [Lachnospiraceae bacterium]|jgi:3-dehydroquinate dehydratase-1|nr:type I 3-dehydroquinate dehydratase [Lachnospiraceae bacterium]MDD3615182.1 type I 3-dehydroquinate dehydratase [Lachnospiraceae bacterium]
MNPVIVRDVKIGEDIPKICVPIVGVTREEILNEAKSFENIPLDIVEWRVDWYEDVFDFEKVESTLKELRNILKNIPVLFTFRTIKEGGEKSIEVQDYVELNIRAAKSGYVDLIDVEVFTGDKEVKEIIEEAHASHVKVVASNHDFHKTPAQDEIVSRLRKMQELDADIPKIAVMPKSPKDVLTLLAATEEMAGQYAKGPIITMSMAADGVISRLCGEIFGSALTFGAASKTSAPGQIGVRELKNILEILHNKEN